MTAATGQVRQIIERVDGFTDVTDTRPPPGVEVAIQVNRAEAARHGADIHLPGQAIQLLIQGDEASDDRPGDVDGALDVRGRLAPDAGRCRN